MADVRLPGCRPEPLAAYLKALGVLRLVALQADPHARGWWDGDAFVVRSRLDRDGLVAFFASDYAPTPAVNPWNGSGGFFFRERKSSDIDPATGKRMKTGVRDEPTAATRLIDAVGTSRSPRLAAFRDAIAVSRDVLRRFGFDAAPSDDDKVALVRALRAELPDAAVEWMDTCLFMAERLHFPAVLGTGGNDGNLNFATNFLTCLLTLMSADDGAPSPGSAAALRASLFATAEIDMPRLAVGQFLPARSGGANTGPGFFGSPASSAWDYVLMIEGCVMLRAAASRQLESASHGSVAVPFAVRATAAAYAAAAGADESTARSELWLPMWSRPSTLGELRSLFGEGRAKVNRRTAANGTDFARAVAGLGIDRGVAEFVRYGFHNRFGNMYYATPLGRWTVPARRNQAVDLLSGIDEWLDRLRRAVAGRPPASVERAQRGLEAAVLSLCARSEPASVQAVLVALGACEAALARSLRYAVEAFLRPVPALEPAWLDLADDGTAEFRLAAALAAAGLRERLVPVRDGRWQAEDDGRTTWTRAGLTRNLTAWLLRREVEWSREGVSDIAARRGAAAGDIAAFVAGAVDDARVEAVARGLALIDWRRAPLGAPGPRSPMPPASYAVLALVTGRRVRDEVLPATPGALVRAAAGDSAGATALALRRLAGIGLRYPLPAIPDEPARARRVAAAVAFPLLDPERERLFELLFPKTRDEENDDADARPA